MPNSNGPTKGADMRRVLSILLLGIVGLFAYTALAGQAPRKPTTKVLDRLDGHSARDYVQTLEATNPAFKRHLAAADAAWAARGQHRNPGHDVVYTFAIRDVRRASIWERWHPSLHAQSYDDGRGVVVFTGYSGDTTSYNGSVYIEEYGVPDANISNDWTVNTDDETTRWVSRDRGDFCHTRAGCDANRRQQGGWLARVVRVINPIAALEACDCSDIYIGRAGNCLLRAALGRARNACIGAVAGCRASGLGYFDCLGGICTGSVYVYFIDEFVDLVSQGC
jgi:hypothetical protein